MGLTCARKAGGIRRNVGKGDGRDTKVPRGSCYMLTVDNLCNGKSLKGHKR